MKKSEMVINWEVINFLMVFVIFGSIFFFMSVGHISSIFYKIGFPVNIALGLIHKIYKKNGRFRKPVIVLRTVAIINFILVFIAPVILLNFKNTKLMYPVKRFCYSYGVYGIADNDILPSDLPEKCENYMFITQGDTLAQDYHPSAYLVFHTDSETLKEYENHFNSMNDAERQTAHMPNQEEKQFPDDIRYY